MVLENDDRPPTPKWAYQSPPQHRERRYRGSTAGRGHHARAENSKGPASPSPRTLRSQKAPEAPGRATLDEVITTIRRKGVIRRLGVIAAIRRTESRELTAKGSALRVQWEDLQRHNARTSENTGDTEEGPRPPNGEPMDVPDSAKVARPQPSRPPREDGSNCLLVIAEEGTGKVLRDDNESKGPAGGDETEKGDASFIKVSGSGKSGDDSKCADDPLTQTYMVKLTEMLGKIEPVALEMIAKVEQRFRDKSDDTVSDRDASGGDRPENLPVVTGHYDLPPPYAKSQGGAASRTSGDAGMYHHTGERSAAEKGKAASAKKVRFLKDARRHREPGEARARDELDKELAAITGVRSVESQDESAKGRLESVNQAREGASELDEYGEANSEINTVEINTDPIRVDELRSVEDIMAEYEVTTPGLGAEAASASAHRGTWGNTLWEHIAAMGPENVHARESKLRDDRSASERAHGVGLRRLSLIGAGPTINALYQDGTLLALTIDTGADRNHAGPGCSGLTNVRDLAVPIVAVMANGDRTEITKHGTVSVILIDAEGGQSRHSFDVLVTEGMMDDDILISCHELTRVVGQFRAAEASSGLSSVCVPFPLPTEGMVAARPGGVARRIPVTVAQNRREGREQRVNDPRAVGGSYVMLAHRQGDPPTSEAVEGIVREYNGTFAEGTDGEPTINSRAVFNDLFGEQGDKLFDERMEAMSLPPDHITTRSQEREDIEELLHGVNNIAQLPRSRQMQGYIDRKNDTAAAKSRASVAVRQLLAAQATDARAGERRPSPDAEWALTLRAVEIRNLTEEVAATERQLQAAREAEGRATAELAKAPEPGSILARATGTKELVSPILQDGNYHTGDVVTVTCDGGAGEFSGRRGKIVERTEGVLPRYVVDFGVGDGGERQIGQLCEAELRAYFNPLGLEGHRPSRQTAIGPRRVAVPPLPRGATVTIRGLKSVEGRTLNGKTARVSAIRGERVHVVDENGDGWSVPSGRVMRASVAAKETGGQLDSAAFGPQTAARSMEGEHKAGEVPPTRHPPRWSPKPGDYVDVNGQKGVLQAELASRDGGVGEYCVKVRGQDPEMIYTDELVQWKGRAVDAGKPGEQYHCWPPQLYQAVTLGGGLCTTEHRMTLVTNLGAADGVGYDSVVTVATTLGERLTVGLDDIYPCPGGRLTPEAKAAFEAVIAEDAEAAAQGMGQAAEEEPEIGEHRDDAHGSQRPAEDQEEKTTDGVATAEATGEAPQPHHGAGGRGPGESPRYGVLIGDRLAPGGDTIMWPPGVRQFVQHHQRTGLVVGRSNSPDGNSTVYRVKRMADGVETHDVQADDLRPCLHDPDDVGADGRPTSLAPGLRKGSRKKHPRVGGTRWVVNTILSAYTLHLMFGHAGYDRVKRTLGATFGAQLKGEWPCEGCQDSCEGCRANSKRRKFLKKRTAVRSRQPMVEISMDHPGVLRGAGRGLPTSLTGGKVPHLSMCSGSSYVFAHELEDFSGGQVATVVTDILGFCNSIGIPRVPKWLSDGAMCYIGGPVPKMIAASGGTMEYTNANSSNGNAKVERIIGSIYGMARAMLAHSKLPMCFWFEALSWAAKLHNCMAGTDSRVTPHELVFGRPPVIDEMLHVFGSSMTVTDVTPVRRSDCKLQPRSTKAFFTGVPNKQRGVRGVAPAARGPKGPVVAIITSRDAFVHDLLKPRAKTPPELLGLMGPKEDEDRARKNLRHTPHHAPVLQAVGGAGGVRDELPPELHDEPRAAHASTLFDGQPVMSIDPTGLENRWGWMRGATPNRQPDGSTVFKEEHPARVLYNVLWEDGVEEFLTWPDVQPFLVQGMTEPERQARGASAPRDTWRCSQGHLTHGETVTTNGGQVITCDECDSVIPEGSTTFTCSRGGCDWDKCAECATPQATGRDNPETVDFEERNRLEEAAASQRRNQWTQARDRRAAIDSDIEREPARPKGDDHDDEADDGEKYDVGDDVNALYDGKWYDAKIVGATADGEITVQYRDRTQQRVEAERIASDIRLPAGPATAAARAVSTRKVAERAAQRGRDLRDAETVARSNQRETPHGSEQGSPLRPESINQRMARSTGEGEGLETATRTTTSHGASLDTAMRGGGGSGDDGTGKKGEGGESKEDGDGLKGGRRRPPKMSTERQEVAFGRTEHLEFREGDTTTAMARADHDAESPGWIILRRGVEGQTRAEHAARSGAHAAATGPTWAAWLPLAKAGLEGRRDPGTAEAFTDGGGRGVIWITTSREANETSQQRAASWAEGLAGINNLGAKVIKNGTFYMHTGVGMGIKAKTWWKDYLPEIGRFAVKSGEHYGARTVVMRKSKDKVEWFEEDKMRNWATRDALWNATIEAVDEAARGSGAYNQSEKRGQPSIEATLRAIDNGAGVFDVTAGITDPAAADGVYEAGEGPLVDSNIEGLRRGYYDVDPDKCDWDKCAECAAPQEPGRDHHDKTCARSSKHTFPPGAESYEAGPNGPRGGGGIVGAPVRFARNAKEHETIRANRAGGHTAQCLFVDPVPKPGMSVEERQHAASNRDKDEIARRRELRRLAVAIEREEDTAAVLAGRVLNESGVRNSMDGEENGRPRTSSRRRAGEEEGASRGEPKRSAPPSLRGTRIRSSWAMVRAWRVCLTSKESVELLLRPEEAEPTLRDALSGPMRYVWLHACVSEVLTQLHQGTFRVVRRDETMAKDPGCNVMQSGMRLLVKWGYCDPIGQHGPTRFKARFIAGGDTQIRGVDYMYTSSPTPRPATIRWMFGKAADPGWRVYSTDVSGAFCISPAEYDNMFMECPRFLAPDDQGRGFPDGLPPRERDRRRATGGEGGVPEGYCDAWDPMGAAQVSRSNARRRKPNYSDFILHLITQCYGTKQASMLWYKLWSSWMRDRGFRRSDGDECLWYRTNPDSGALLIIATHVDDSLCLTNDPEEYAKFVAEMKASFECTDEEEVQYFLGVRVQADQEKNTMVLSQEALSDAIVSEAKAAGCALSDTPMIDSQYLVTGGEWEQIDPTVEGGGLDTTEWELDDPEPRISTMERRAVAMYPYRRILGMMIHLTTWTRPELAFVVSSLAKYSDPCRCRWVHVQAMARVVAYIAGTTKLGLRYVGSETEDPGMVAWVDADHAGNPSTRLSVTGFVIHCRGAAIQWQSGRQKLAAQSSFESELIASRAVTAEMMALAKDYLAIEQRPLPTPFRIGCDNMAVCAVSEGAGKYSKRKFIAIRYFLIRRAVRQGLLVLCSVPTDWNVADLFTKSLGWDKLRRFRDKTMNVEGRVVEDGESWLTAKGDVGRVC